MICSRIQFRVVLISCNDHLWPNLLLFSWGHIFLSFLIVLTRHLLWSCWIASYSDQSEGHKNHAPVTTQLHRNFNKSIIFLRWCQIFLKLCTVWWLLGWNIILHQMLLGSAPGNVQTVTHFKHTLGTLASILCFDVRLTDLWAIKVGRLAGTFPFSIKQQLYARSVIRTTK